MDALKHVEANRTESVIEVRSRPDNMGRQSLMAYWWDDGFHTGPSARAQCFFTNLDDLRRRTEKRGYSVLVVESIDTPVQVQHQADWGE